MCLWCRLSELPLRPDLWSFDWLDFAWTLEYRESACCQGLTLPALVLCLALFPGRGLWCGGALQCPVLLPGPQSAGRGFVGSSFACRSVSFPSSCCWDLRVLAVASLGARLLVGRSRFLRLAAGTSECLLWPCWEFVCL